MPRPLAYLALLLTFLVGLLPVDAMAGDNPRIAVLGISGKMDVAQRNVLSDQVRKGVLQAVSGRDYQVMSRENMAVMAKSQGLDLTCLDGECEVETGAIGQVTHL